MPKGIICCPKIDVGGAMQEGIGRGKVLYTGVMAHPGECQETTTPTRF